MLEVTFKSQYKTTDGRRCITVEARKKGATSGAVHEVFVPADTPPAQVYTAIAQQVMGGIPEDDPLRDAIQAWIDSGRAWEVDPARYAVAKTEAAETAESL